MTVVSDSSICSTVSAIEGAVSNIHSTSARVVSAVMGGLHD
jgi:hypothetical protein